MFLYIHTTLQTILHLIPSASTALYDALFSNFPLPVTQDPISYKIFSENALKIINYCPSLNQRILEVCIDKCIQMDASIKLEDAPDQDDELIFDLDENAMQETQVLAEKLDFVMDLLFEYIDKHSTTEESSLETFELILRVFDQKILTTYKSKFPQFLLFYVCQKNSDLYCEKFLAYLLNKFLDTNQSLNIRQTCAAYVGSFISRASFVNLEIVKRVISFETDWIHKYLVIYNSFFCELKNFNVIKIGNL